MDKASHPLVSVITPSFNQDPFLEETICSVLGQEYPHIEYLIIDGGSTDTSVNIIKYYGDRIAYWVSERDTGQSHAINKGLMRARGEIIGWLNSDDVFVSGAVQKVVNAFQKFPKADVIYGHLERIDAASKHIPTPRLPKDKVTFNKKHALDECVVNQPGCFWRRSMMNIVGLLSEDLHYTMDYEYWTRILIAGGNFMRLDDTLARFRVSSTSKTVGQTAKMAKEGLSVIESFLTLPDISTQLGLAHSQLLKQANRGRASMSLHAFYGCVKEKKWGEGLKWLTQATQYDPLILMNRKWFDLAIQRLKNKRITYF